MIWWLQMNCGRENVWRTQEIALCAMLIIISHEPRPLVPVYIPGLVTSAAGIDDPLTTCHNHGLSGETRHIFHTMARSRLTEDDI